MAPGEKMKRIRRREITIEFDEVFTIRRPQRSITAWCGECAGQVFMLTPEEAAVQAGVSSRAIYRWIEAAAIHFAETADGRVFVCPNSLSR